MDTAITSADVLTYLQITAVLMVVIVLYHLLFIAVDLRKILRRVQMITKEVEGLIMKPINVADHILEGIVKFLEEQQKSAEPKKKSSSKKKSK